jgi:hypothetical protein
MRQKPPMDYKKAIVVDLPSDSNSLQKIRDLLPGLFDKVRTDYFVPHFLTRLEESDDGLSDVRVPVIHFLGKLNEFSQKILKHRREYFENGKYKHVIKIGSDHEPTAHKHVTLFFELACGFTGLITIDNEPIGDNQYLKLRCCFLISPDHEVFVPEDVMRRKSEERIYLYQRVEELYRMTSLSLN